MATLATNMGTLTASVQQSGTESQSLGAAMTQLANAEASRAQQMTQMQADSKKLNDVLVQLGNKIMKMEKSRNAGDSSAMDEEPPNKKQGNG